MYIWKYSSDGSESEPNGSDEWELNDDHGPGSSGQHEYEDAVRTTEYASELLLSLEEPQKSSNELCHSLPIGGVWNASAFSL